MYSLAIPYRAIPWARAGGRSVRYDTQVPDKAALSSLIYRTLCEQYFPDGIKERPLFSKEKMVEVIATFCFKDERSGKKGQLAYPKMDTDNLFKFLQDTLQSQYLEGVIWADDKQVTRIIAEKCYGPRDMIFLTMTELELKENQHGEYSSQDRPGADRCPAGGRPLF